MKSWIGFCLATALIVPSSTASYAEEEKQVRTLYLGRRHRIALMPCMDKSSNQVPGMNQSVEENLCTDTLKQLVRDSGAKTVSWFKVVAAMKKILSPTSLQSNENPFLTGSNSFAGASRQDYTSDRYILELIQAAKQVGAKYVVRPAVLSKDAGATSTMKQGFFSWKNEIETKANVTVNIDIISVPEEDIVASRSFDGVFNSKETKKGLATTGNIALDSPYKVALNDALSKTMEYIAKQTE